MPSLQGVFPNGLPVVLLSTNYSDPLLLLVDTGSAVSLITDRVLRPDADIQPIRIRVEAVTRDQIPIIGRCDTQLYKHDRELGNVNFLVTTQPMDQFDGILGNDWLASVRAQVDYGNGLVITDTVSIPFQRRASVKTAVCGLTVKTFIPQGLILLGKETMRCSKDLLGSDGKLRLSDGMPQILYQDKDTELPRSIAARLSAKLMRCLSCTDECEMELPYYQGNKMPQKQLTGSMGCPEDTQVRGSSPLRCVDRRKKEKSDPLKPFQPKKTVSGEGLTFPGQESENRHENVDATSTKPERGSVLSESSTSMKPEQGSVLSESSNSRDCPCQEICVCKAKEMACPDPECRCEICRCAGKRKRMILYAKERTVLDANTTAAIEVTYAKVKHGKPDNRLLQTRSVVQANRRNYLIGNAVMHFATFMAIPYCNLTDDNFRALIKRLGL